MNTSNTSAERVTITTTASTTATPVTAPPESRSLTSAPSQALSTIRASIQRYIASTRAQLDIAIAEGQATAASTRQQLEARFNQAKTDPQSARSAFK